MPNEKPTKSLKERAEFEIHEHPHDSVLLETLEGPIEPSNLVSRFLKFFRPKKKQLKVNLAERPAWEVTHQRKWSRDMQEGKPDGN